MAKVILLLGTNLGDKRSLLLSAIEQIGKLAGEVIEKSMVYKTPAWGYESGNEFYNQVILIHTFLSPEDLLQKLKKLELDLGRDPLKQSMHGVYQDRLIDIDILFYDKLIYTSKHLTIPHPRLHKRSFTLFPLEELCPEFIHPFLNKSINTLLLECEDLVVPVKLT